MAQVTPESIANGTDRELSRVTERGRAILFLKTEYGALGIASCRVAPNGSIEKVFGVSFLDTDKLSELDGALMIARERFERP